MSKRVPAKALFDFPAEQDGDLGFSAGDYLWVLSQDPSGWWKGEKDGKSGVFPYNYVEVVSADDVPAGALPGLRAAAPAAAAALGLPAGAAAGSRVSASRPISARPTFKPPAAPGSAAARTTPAAASRKPVGAARGASGGGGGGGGGGGDSSAWSRGAPSDRAGSTRKFQLTSLQAFDDMMDRGFSWEPHDAGAGATAGDGDAVDVHYTMMLWDGAQTLVSELESTLWGSGEPMRLNVGSGQLPPGLDAGLRLMPAGASGMLTLTPEMAFGEDGCAERSVPPGAHLVFEMDVVAIHAGAGVAPRMSSARSPAGGAAGRVASIRVGLRSGRESAFVLDGAGAAGGGGVGGGRSGDMTGASTDELLREAMKSMGGAPGAAPVAPSPSYVSSPSSAAAAPPAAGRGGGLYGSRTSSSVGARPPPLPSAVAGAAGFAGRGGAAASPSIFPGASYGTAGPATRPGSSEFGYGTSAARVGGRSVMLPPDSSSGARTSATRKSYSVDDRSR
eukprot:PLAT2617.1.p1 GENE.PLAT2617.1~~PLAT2617.1.p1  ORF type:complete len:554 (+),score=174.90 PLAT2617.1:151-1662(+)